MAGCLSRANVVEACVCATSNISDHAPRCCCMKDHRYVLFRPSPIADRSTFALSIQGLSFQFTLPCLFRLSSDYLCDGRVADRHFMKAFANKLKRSKTNDKLNNSDNINSDSNMSETMGLSKTTSQIAYQESLAQALPEHFGSPRLNAPSNATGQSACSHYSKYSKFCPDMR